MYCSSFYQIKLGLAVRFVWDDRDPILLHVLIGCDYDEYRDEFLNFLSPAKQED